MSRAASGACTRSLTRARSTPAGGGSTNELAIVDPAVAVALGVTAARALMRKALSINVNRGRLIDLPNGGKALITVHPSYLLRLQEERDKRRQFNLLVRDLRLAADKVVTIPEHASTNKVICNIN